MVRKKHKNWSNRRYDYDSYRPAFDREAVPKHHPGKSWKCVIFYYDNAKGGQI